MPTWAWLLVCWPVVSVAVVLLWGWARRGPQTRWADCVEDSEDSRWLGHDQS